MARRVTVRLRPSQWDPVIVEWVDSAGCDDDWHEVPEGGHPIRGCVTVGMFYSRTDEALTVVGSRDPVSGLVRSSLTIPVASVTSIRRLS